VLHVPGNYGKLPLTLLRRPDVSPQAKILWAALAHNQADPERFATVGHKPMTHADLMGACGMPRRSLQRGLEELRRAGLLQIVRKKRRGRTPLLRVLLPALDDETRANLAQVPPETRADLAQVPPETRADLAQDPRQSGAPSFVTHGTKKGGQAAPSPPAPVAPCIENTAEPEWPALLAQAYLARTIRQVTFADAAAGITEHLRDGLSACLLAAYLDATPHVRAWPSELADKTLAWFEAERLKAFRTELIRIRQGALFEAVRATADGGGEEVGQVRFVDPRADPPRLVIEIDHTPAALPREAQIARLRKDLAKMPATMQRSAYERGRRAELESLEAGGQPIRPERRVERVDVRTSEALAAWVFRPVDAVLPGFDDESAREAIAVVGQGAPSARSEAKGVTPCG